MNIKWYINNEGIKVKPCARCKKEFPYTTDFFRSMNENGKIGAYCFPCEKETQKEIRRKKSKTGKFNTVHTPFEKGGVVYKKCNVCSLDFPYNNEYYDASSHKDGGLKPYCRNCRRNTNRENKRAQWQKALLRNSRASTKDKGMEKSNITEEFILELWSRQNGKCYWFGVSMVPSSQKKSLMQPSLDRLDRSKGYVIGNVVLCTFAANFGRNENNEDEWKRFLITLQNSDYSQWQ